MEKFSKYFSFNGVANRSEYWAVVFIALGLSFFTLVLAGIVTEVVPLLGVLFYLVAVVTSVAGLVAVTATTARRCADAGISKWFTALIFVPYVALIADIVFGVIPTAAPKSE